MSALALDRQAIVKQDFPTSRKGYDREAVDAHLAAVAGELEALQSAPGGGAQSLASAASEQVRTVIAAAERSAAAITAAAEEHAARARSEAEADAAGIRAEAGAWAEDGALRAREAAAAMLQRVEAIDRELDGLLEHLHAGVRQAGADLAAGPQVGGAEPAPEPAAHDAVDGADDSARLIALNTMLGGGSREEAEEALEAHFGPADRTALLDDVAATVAAASGGRAGAEGAPTA